MSKSNNLEIVMNLDTLEVYEVIDLDETESLENQEVPDQSTAPTKPENSMALYERDSMGRIWMGDGWWYSPSALLWEVVEDGIVHRLYPKNKHGTYPYDRKATDYSWGHIS